MLDLRIYRAAFLPLAFVLVVVAFSLHARPAPLGTTLAPDAFDGARAERLLGDLATAFPDRRAGSAGDAALAVRVAAALRRTTGFHVRERAFRARTVLGPRQLRTVIAERPGLLSGRIVVLAHRDAYARGSRAELSATAALLELAQVFDGRVTRRTLTLVSTSGGAVGAAGAADFAEHPGGPVDAVIVLGDVGGTVVRRPLVVPWSNARALPPFRLQRTVEEAVRAETAAAPGATHATGQFLRLAFPLTVGEQGPLNAAGLPAVLLGASGERAPAPDEPTSAARLRALGRAALRSITALDEGPGVGPVVAGGVQIRGQVMPRWSVRLLVAGLLLPALLAAVDAAFRVRRRRRPPGRWVAWTLAGALPFLLGGLFVLALRAVGLLDAPPAPVAGPALPAQLGGLAAALAVVGLGWLVGRRALVRRVRPPGGVGEPGAAAGVALATVLAAAAVWIVNPFAAAFLVLPAHLWLLASAPEVPLRRPAALALVAAGAVPLALAVLGYAFALHAGPLHLASIALLLVAGGHVGPAGLVLGSVLIGCGCSAAAVAARRAAPPSGPAGTPADVRSRGPLTYAGPGSLGGTDSALRGPVGRR